MKVLLLVCLLSFPLFEGATGCVVKLMEQIPVALDICESITLDNVYVPPGETLKLHLRNGTKLFFRGVTTFSHYEWEGPLVEIHGFNVTIEGEENSVLDGQGQFYWDGQGEWGSLKPKFFTIQLQNSSMKNIHVLNNPIHCVNLVNSSNVRLDGWVIDASSGDSEVAGVDKAGHNTDGFDIWNSHNVVLSNGVVHNQDDCVALRSGYNILVDDMICYGGHGLSISVGFSRDTFGLNFLENVTISNSILEGGENGIHIKTHVDGGFGLMKNITYDNITFEGPAKYGINIQENYRNMPENFTAPIDPKNNIPIWDLKFTNIVGSVEPTAVPIYILCADQGCFNWTFTNVMVAGNKSNECNFEPEGFKCI